jgi:RimJ/RimL family protein N-acetyltransferase
MIETERLILRPWRAEDVGEFVRVTNTPAVMEFLGGVREPESFWHTYERVTVCQGTNGFCFWIVERRSDRALLGFCGLKIGNTPRIEGEIEIGWRLREDAWGQGYAREAAAAVLDWAWRNLDCGRVVAITAAGNVRSWGLMERLGMRRLHQLDFEHPDLPVGNEARPHITYAINRPPPQA